MHWRDGLVLPCLYGFSLFCKVCGKCEWVGMLGFMWFVVLSIGLFCIQSFGNKNALLTKKKKIQHLLVNAMDCWSRASSVLPLL